MSTWRAALLIAGKDLRAELRGREALSAMGVFALLAGVLFSFAFNADRVILRQIFPGLVWVVTFFAGTLGLGRSYHAERVSLGVHGLMLAPIDRGAIFLGKALGNLALVLVVQAVAVPVFWLLFDLPGLASPALFAGAIGLGTAGFIGAGTFLSALVAHTRAAEVLLPILLFPLLVPVLLGATQLSAAAFGDVPWEEVAVWVRVLAVYDVVFLVLPWLLFDFLLEV